MNLSELLGDKYTVLFVLILVLLVSVWVSRTYRNGGFSRWIAPSEGYGTGVIEGLAVADHVRYEGEIRTQVSHAPADTTGSRSDGSLIINRCSYVKNTPTTFRFLFTTTAQLRGVNGETAAKAITIKVPSYYIQNTDATGMKATIRAYTGPLPATVGTSAGTATDLNTADASRGLAVSVPASGAADYGYCVITYTIQSSTPMEAGKYALELSGLKWVNTEITPGVTAAPGAGLANVSLASNAEAAGSQTLVLVNLSPSDSTNMKQLRIFDTTAYGGLPDFIGCRKISTEGPQLSPNYTGTATTFSTTIMLTNALVSGDIFLVQVPYVTHPDSTFDCRSSNSCVEDFDHTSQSEPIRVLQHHHLMEHLMVLVVYLTMVNILFQRLKLVHPPLQAQEHPHLPELRVMELLTSPARRHPFLFQTLNAK